MNKKPKIHILDTNVILHDNECLYSFQEHDVGIPIEVIMELDNHKKGSDSTNYNAREALRAIEAMPREKIYDGGASLGEGLGKLRIIVGYPYHGEVRKVYAEQTMDHRILNATYCLATAKKSITAGLEVILVSKDVNLRIKSGALGLTAEDYTTDVIPEANSFYKEVKHIDVPDSILTDVYAHKEVYFDGMAKLYENEFVVCNSSNANFLGYSKNGKIRLVQDNMHSFGIKSRNPEQTFALQALHDENINLLTLAGKAGTGKTLLAISTALQLLKEKKFDQVYFTRQIMGLSDKDLGYLPGDINDKVSPYMKCLYDNISVLKKFDKNRELIDKYLKEEKLIIEPLAFIRGRSIPNTYFIIDEAQNLNRKEAKSILTRAGEGTKIILMGDVTQIDSPYLDQSSNGLSHVISKMQGQSIYAHVTLMKGERSFLAELAGNLL